MAEFFAMNGYAGFVWPAFGLSAVILIGLFVSSLRAMRRTEAELAALKGTDGGENA